MTKEKNDNEDQWLVTPFKEMQITRAVRRASTMEKNKSVMYGRTLLNMDARKYRASNEKMIVEMRK